MAFRNDRTERARLQKLWITEQDRPCSICGSKDQRDIAHIVPYYMGGETTEKNCRVLCHVCNLAEHPSSKFLVGDTVRVNGRTPAYVDIARGSPRTIISIRYDSIKQCNFYRLGSNGKGNMKDGQPLEGFEYEFRSYQLKPYKPRPYHFKRRYRRHQASTTQPIVSRACCLSQKIVSNQA